MWFLVRISVYLAVILGLLLYRGGVPWRRFVAAWRASGDRHPSLVVAGRDVAPPLVEALAGEYRRDYPQLAVTVLGGGTYRALDQLLARECDVAFLMRAPTPAEQALFREADHDTAVTQDLAVGGLVLVAGAAAPTGPLTMAALKEALASRAAGPVLAGPGVKLYAPDPNEGTWDALLAALGLPADDTAAAGGAVVFLPTAADVLAAVAADPGAWGVVSTLNAALEPEAGPPAGLAFVGVVETTDKAAVAPTRANVGTGDYPLHHFLYAACRGSGSQEGVKFLTHLGSARGLRQVEATGAIPARLVARTIQLTRDPVGRAADPGGGK